MKMFATFFLLTVYDSSGNVKISKQKGLGFDHFPMNLRKQVDGIVVNGLDIRSQLQNGTRSFSRRVGRLGKVE